MSAARTGRRGPPPSPAALQAESRERWRSQGQPQAAGQPWPASFAARLIDWQRRHGRHGLPWQVADPYAIWLSEVMLQQTQVATVLRYYPRFLARFPNVRALAQATLDEVLAQWSGLGYYRRARMLHAAAVQVVQQRAGCLPRSAAEWADLPGIGRSTAAAIAAFSHGERAAILDGNVKRVFGRLFAADLGPAPSEPALWRLAERLLPDPALAAEGGMAAYTQGLMDLGATLCSVRQPNCPVCPFATDCDYARATPTPQPDSALQGTAGRGAARLRRSERCVMLLLRRGGRLLFEQRPALGIWPGLWCLPQAPDEPAAAQLAAALLGRPAPVALELGAAIKHGFTHFDLWATPAWPDGEATPVWPDREATPAWPAGVGDDAKHQLPSAVADSAAGPARCWLAEAEFADYGMPALVHKLLKAVG